MIRLVLLALVAGAASAQPTVGTAYESPRIAGVAALGPQDSDSDAGAVRPPGDDWIARDKAMHLGASFLLTLSGQYVLTDKTGWSDGEALPVAAGAALALGLLKEVADSRRARGPHFCWRDLAADAAGVALAAAVVGL